MNAKLSAITEKAVEDFRALMKENEKLLLESWSSAEQEATDNEQKPKFKFGFSVTLDLDKDAMASDLTFGVRYKRTVCAAIPNPDQRTFDDTMMTIKTGDEEVTLTGKQFHEAAERARAV